MKFKEKKMKILVLGCGIQGKAVLFHLSRSDQVRKVICADYYPENLGKFSNIIDKKKIKIVKVDASDQEALMSIMHDEIDVVIDVLPPQFMGSVFEAAIGCGVSLVNTNYAHSFRNLHQQALEKDISIMPECGLDPGIDLVIYGHSVSQFDEIHILNSYCGGIPERKACDNPLNYKISWNWDAALRAQKREAVFKKNGKNFLISPEDQHKNDMIHEIEFSGLGKLEAFPNGDAVFYTDLLGITSTIKETGRYSLRWPGWCAFMHSLKKLNFLGDELIEDFPFPISPHQFMVKLLEPQLQYKENEKDIVVMRNVFIGIKNQKKKKIINNLIIERDMNTGLLAMSIGVGYTASIVAQMIGSGEINKKGILSPVFDIPYESFMKKLSQNDIQIEEKIEVEE
jgi:saccharopine dehydrogenase-like NADP-dependent oxidoreductase